MIATLSRTLSMSPNDYIPRRDGGTIVIPSGLAWTIVIAMVTGGIFVGNQVTSVNGKIDFLSTLLTESKSTTAAEISALKLSIAELRSRGDQRTDARNKQMHDMEIRLRDLERMVGTE